MFGPLWARLHAKEYHLIFIVVRAAVMKRALASAIGRPLLQNSEKEK